MSKYLDQWIEYLQEEGKSSNTISSYKKDVEQFDEYLDSISKDITELNKNDVENYKQRLLDKDISISSLNRKLASINNFFTFLLDELNIVIPVRIKSEKVQKKTYLDDVLTMYDIEKLINVTTRNEDYRAKAIICTLAYTGLRVSEMLSLKVKDVNNNIIQVKGKGNKYRKVLIPDKLQEVLNEYLEYRIARDTPYLFTSSTGRSGVLTRSRVDVIIKKYGVKAKINPNLCHAHMFRHYFCKSMIEKGMDITTVGSLAGHNNINTTTIYTQKTGKEMLKELNTLTSL